MPVLDIHTGFPTPPLTRCVNLSVRATSSTFDNSFVRPSGAQGIQSALPRQERSVRSGSVVFNLFNHFNPRDVQNDLDSQRFGDFFNGPPRTFRGKFVFGF